MELLVKSGSRATVQLPAQLLDAARLDAEQRVDARVDGQAIIIIPASQGKDDASGQSILDRLAMPGAAEVDFDPQPLKSPLFRPAEFPDGPG